ncbi:MAG TPA: hypothetical protein VHE80_01745 [Acidimicrobiales bacterium]|nr:hypothetical protein [Acidimicrobiales bacterium]
MSARGSATTTTAGVDHEDALRLADRLASVYATYQGTEEVFTPDVLFDVNVPAWRFQVQGADAFFSWLRGHSPEGYGITLVRAVPTSSGFVAEVEGEYRPHGVDLYFRNLLLCEVEDDRISEVVFFCTGDWDPGTRARQAAEAPMVRA